MVEIIIAGIVVLIITSAKCNHCPEHTKNLDKGLEQRIDTFYDVLQIMRGEVQGIKVRSRG